MYDELVKRLRFAVYEEDTDGIVRILEEAADAIEELSKPRCVKKNGFIRSFPKKCLFKPKEE